LSYLGYPRITFAGKFQADPSTVNNSPANFDDAAFLARYQDPGAADGGWNPRGTGAWRLRGCKVTGVRAADAGTASEPMGALTAANDRVSAKLVDLDPAQQQVSMVFGLGLVLRLPDGTEGFEGDFVPSPFSDIWLRCPAAPAGFMQGASAVYQSVIDVSRWGGGNGSPILRQLRDATAEEKLSIKFMVDGFDPVRTSPTFTWGRIVGSIGPYTAGEPHHFVAARVLAPLPGASGGPAPCVIDEEGATVTLDLGNSLATTVPGGALADAGALRLIAKPAGGEPTVLGTLGPGAPFYDAFYTSQAGILVARLTPSQIAAASDAPLALIDATGAVRLAEDLAGRYLRADEFVFRMSPGDKVPVTVHATSFGRPAAGVTVTTRRDASQLGPPRAGVPESALTFPDSVATGTDGRAEIELTASDPGNPRGFIDGQVYGVAYGWDGDEAPAQGNELSLLVWDAYPPPEAPTWVADVQPILQQYANLYPIMRDVVDLADYADVALAHNRALSLAMGLPETDPNYMPVTRDLSPAKRNMILNWLKEPEPPVFRINDVESLRQVLQLAVELEHATIPPYLCALFSIVPGQNQEVADLIKSVVMQEMLHMALACNLLNAVGGSPSIARGAFVPKFPGHLPGGVRPHLTVSLRKCSIEQVRDVFMAIEEPSKPLHVPKDVPSYVDMTGIEVDPSGNVIDKGRAADAAEQLAAHLTGVEHEPLTIGWFYQQIGKAIVELGDEIFTGSPALQMTPEIYTGAPGNVYAITGTTDALLALQEIERQGEGTPGTDPTDGPRHELAHYFRFKEIVEGRRMIETSPGVWEFAGPTIEFDPAGVLPMADNPDTGSLPAGSQVRSAATLCDRTYGDLLRALHRTFNGSPETLGPAVGLMFSLEVQARELMTMQISADAGNAGPAFQPL
jgi:Ferritin-like